MDCKTLIKQRLVQALIAVCLILSGAITTLSVVTSLPPATNTTALGPFKSATEIDYTELETLMKMMWPQSDKLDITFSGSDGCYLLYSLEDFKEFQTKLESEYTYKTQNGDFNDCDDRAIIAYGREREWFTAHDPGNSTCGSSFGLIVGWMNYLPNPNCSQWRGHMMNIFADNELNVWGYDVGAQNVFLVSKDWCNNTYVEQIFI